MKPIPKLTEGPSKDRRLTTISCRRLTRRTWEVVPAEEEGSPPVRREPLEEVVADGEVSPHREGLRRGRAQDALFHLELPRWRRRRRRGLRRRWGT